MKLIALGICCFLFSNGWAQPSQQRPTKGINRPIFNHLAYYVYDLQVSTHFYTAIIGLDTTPTPFKDTIHTWLPIGASMTLHLIEGNVRGLTHLKHNHLCLSVPNMAAIIKKLTQQGIPYEDWAGTPNQITKRVDGVQQIYCKDPDGYWLEINDAKQ